MRPLVRWLITREAALAVCVGLVGPLLWTTLESQLVHYVHRPLSQWLIGEPLDSLTAYRWVWRGNQLAYGLLSAALFAVPLSLAFRRDRFRYGVLFVATFLISAVGGMLWAGGAGNIPLLFSLPDTWALVLGSLVLFWFMNRRQLGARGLPSNNTFERDARKSGARPST
jgi:hypothetical protein